VQKLIDGVAKFKSEVVPEHQALFDKLATGQSPEVLFITCADSRIDPALITQTMPGDLFVCRNAGNIVPPHGNSVEGTTASIEFATAVLGVKHIVVCGHTDCGAIKGAMAPQNLDAIPRVQDWVDHARAAVRAAEAQKGDGQPDLLTATERNVVLQMSHLNSHPAVAARLAAGDIDMHGWVYHIGSGDETAYDAESDSFTSISA
jgi:carbonic anhydrase